MHLYPFAAGLVVVVLIYYFIAALRWATSPLRRVPGPFLARFTRLWFFYRVYLGHFEEDNIELHRKHGPVVRIAPSMFSIDLPDAVNRVYGIGSKLPKSEWYEGWKHPDPDKWSVFSDRNIVRHAEMRRRFQSLYSMSSLTSYETYVDECADLLLKRLIEFADRGTPVNMFHWLQCYAFDVIGHITYSERFGFLDRGEDIAGLLEAVYRSHVYSTLIGIYASLHPYVWALTNWLKIGGAAGRSYLMNYTESRIRQRKEEQARRPEKADPSQQSGPLDFLQRLMNQQQEDPSKVTSYHLFTMSLSNILAGSDTTAISLSAILFSLTRHPSVMKKLRDEIEQCIADGRWDGESAHMEFACARDMPYLQAVIKEALRLHPATGLPLWRDVPQSGIELAGYVFPGGSTVGLNAWCAHYNEDMFKDARDFRPERWIEAEIAGGESLRRLNSYYLPFGLGSRTCLGRHISYLEMSKLIPLLVWNFDFELERGPRAWRTLNYWFVKPTDFWVEVKTRHGEPRTV